MVSHGESGFLVNPFDSDDIAKRLKCIFDEKILREKMATEAKNIAQKKFHPIVVAKKTLDVYWDIC